MLQCFISKSIQICYFAYQLRYQISKLLMITIYSAIHLSATERKSNPYYSHSANERNSFCTLFALICTLFVMTLMNMPQSLFNLMKRKVIVHVKRAAIRTLKRFGLTVLRLSQHRSYRFFSN